MTSPTYPVFTGDGVSAAPMRPTAEAHMGGLSFRDSVKHPPKDREKLSATDFMQATMSVERIGRVIPMAQVDVITSSTPTVLRAFSVNEAFTVSVLEFERTSAGNYQLHWPLSASLPPLTVQPRISKNSDTSHRVSWTQVGTSIYITVTDGGTPSNAELQLYIDIYGQ